MEIALNILVGREKRKDFIGSSKPAFEQLFGKIMAAMATEKIFITIS